MRASRRTAHRDSPVEVPAGMDGAGDDDDLAAAMALIAGTVGRCLQRRAGLQSQLHKAGGLPRLCRKQRRLSL